MNEIKITDIENVLIGNAQDDVNATGCSVIISSSC
jgi:L-aminopeptidase/D-esterase-like protein